MPGVSGDRRSGRGGGLWAAVSANLLIGAVAVVPGMCLRWLMTEYPAVDCVSGIGCDKESSDSAFAATAGAWAGGLVVLGMLLVVDVLVPRQEGWPLGRWLGMAVLVPVPFAAGHTLGWF